MIYIPILLSCLCSLSKFFEQNFTYPSADLVWFQQKTLRDVAGQVALLLRARQPQIIHITEFQSCLSIQRALLKVLSNPPAKEKPFKAEEMVS